MVCQRKKISSLVRGEAVPGRHAVLQSHGALGTNWGEQPQQLSCRGCLFASGFFQGADSSKSAKTPGACGAVRVRSENTSLRGLVCSSLLGAVLASSSNVPDSGAESLIWVNMFFCEA